MTPKIPVTVLAGAMGAGKTTLINRIINESGQRILVIENELGEVTVEGAPIISTDEEIFDMDDGLVSGTVRGDLIRALVSVDAPARAIRSHPHRDDRPGRPGADRAHLPDGPGDPAQLPARRPGDAGRRPAAASSTPRGRPAGTNRSLFAERADREQDRPGRAGRGRRDGALAPLGQRNRARPQHQLRQPAARAAARHRPPRDRSRARARHAAVRRPHPRPAAPERAADGDAGGTALPTAKAKGWRVDVGEFPRAIAWGNGSAELAVGDRGRRRGGSPRE